MLMWMTFVRTVNNNCVHGRNAKRMLPKNDIVTHLQFAKELHLQLANQKDIGSNENCYI